LAQGFSHATEQLLHDLPFITLITIGFGTQMGLYVYLKKLHAQHKSATAVSAAGTGTGAVSMVACCAHHAADIIPILGISGAALYLQEFKTPLMLLGITMNFIGIFYMMRKIHQTRRMLIPAK
jgi:hypothetical protein